MGVRGTPSRFWHARGCGEKGGTDGEAGNYSGQRARDAAQMRGSLKLPGAVYSARRSVRYSGLVNCFDGITALIMTGFENTENVQVAGAGFAPKRDSRQQKTIRAVPRSQPVDTSVAVESRATQFPASPFPEFH